MATYDEFAQEWTDKQRSGKNSAHAYLEKPAMYDALPNLEGKDVLCLGCGSGEECAELKARGARRVLGVDSARGLIEQAKYAYPECEFVVGDISRLAFESEFDFVYSSLAVHYVEDFPALCKSVWHSLKPGGEFLFSTHHPVKWGAEITRGPHDSVTATMSYVKTGDEGFEIHGDYLNQRAIRDTWFGHLDVLYYNRSIQDLFQGLRSAGFMVEELREPKPVPSSKNIRKSFYEIYSRIPQFVIFKVRKEAQVSDKL